MNVETQIKLNKFQPRPYQAKILDAIENKGYKRVIAIWPRRAGKDIVAFNLILRAALRKIGTYFYVFPTYSQAKKVIWDSVTNDGQKFLSFIPKELIFSANSQEMKICLQNGSLIQLVGSDNIDSLRGTNPQGIIFSEFAWQDPQAYHILRPILLANDGWAFFISTPNGENHFWDLYEVAKRSPDWFCEFLTLDDTQHISKFEIEKERAEGIMSDDLIQQEYYCSFTMGTEGSYYARYIENLYLKGQIGPVPYEPNFRVHTAWDLGMDDSMAIIFFQTIGTTVHVIDCYELDSAGLEHYAKVLESKPYVYGKHIAPHDIAVREMGTGVSRYEKARNLGIRFIAAPNLDQVDGREAVKTLLPRCWFDEQNCKPLLRALKNYHRTYDNKRKKYHEQPFHDNNSHMADAMRYLAVAIKKTRTDGMTKEDADNLYTQAMYGENNKMPRFFRDDV